MFQKHTTIKLRYFNFKTEQIA